MKKDIFNGNILPFFRGTVIFSLIIGAVVFLACGIIFLMTALFGDNVDEAAKICLYCFSALSILAGIGFPLLTLHFIRIYPKHKKMALFFLRSYVFVDKEEENRYRR